MSKKPPNRPGIIFEVGARIEAQDYLQKWYPSRIEKIDYDEGKMLVHFDRWSHRYDEWIFWDSNRLRPFERPALRKEGLKEDEDYADLRYGEEVLARWTDCRYYPAKIESVNREGTYTVQFYDGVIRCVKRMHIKSMPEDAKGQDWIALVKAATAAAKNRGPCKPRTSANSNKGKDDRKWEKVSSKKDDASCPDEVQEEREEPVNPEWPIKTDISVEEEEKPVVEQHDTIKSKRRKSLGSIFQAKRARLDKITGLLVSKFVNENNSQKKVKNEVSHLQDQAPSTSQEGHEMLEADAALPSPLTSFTPTSANNCATELRQDSGDTEDSQTQLKPSYDVNQIVQIASVDESRCSVPISPPSPPPPPPPPPLPFPSPASNPSDTLHTVQQTTSDAVEKFQLPLDLSKNSKEVTAPPVQVSSSIQTSELVDQAKENTLSVKESTYENASSTVSVVKSVPKTLKPNKHIREPIIHIKKQEDRLSTMESAVDLDHNKFKCKVPGCFKAFRKAKLLDYHLKYYHSTDKETESETGSPDRATRTRATSASVPVSISPENNEIIRRRTVSTSSTVSSYTGVLQLESPIVSKSSKSNKKKRSSASISSEGTDVQCPLPSREKSFESLHEKILKKVIEKDKYPDSGLSKSEKKLKLEEKGKKKDKDKERKEKKEKDHFKVKQKKKKKKKKKSKQHDYSDFDDISLAFLERCPSPPARPMSTVAMRSTPPSKHTTFLYPRAILSVDLTGENLSDIDFLEDSSTESLLLSGDEYNQEFDAFNVDDSQDEDDGSNEIVRCICEMDEENGFMIQCEECMCWQHSVCMGLLEDSIPEQYICYICRDPPGQRWSAKYRHDKDWLSKGHMYGLSFLKENYSHQNAKKIVSTHQLLADIYSVKKVLHGLHLKMDILKNKQNPNLHLWARSWSKSDEEQQIGIFSECKHHHGKMTENVVHGFNQKVEETYIISEHSYQKPSGFGLDHRAANDFMSSDGEDNVRLDEDQEYVVGSVKRSMPFVPKEIQGKSEAVGMGSLDESCAEQVISKDQAVAHLQWQLNLLNHIEDVQSEVASRMDLIEKELDVLESWLDFTGELEPPEPLARLPQLKRRIKQLLTDLGKVQQMSTLCSV
ncbi:PHD finger protein 20-like protein 1 isoform X1 [Erpetoichthys calabaricus]|uniref:PHD finger protein 20-like protein 1 n=1 Tax=Erpetoichthys calabaricus TaxID=27687 RepID=A0A8C4SS70_ERPCA|nr:PHD finger protein 20-like protein 1 isoform X1 [Erpetoichthys calabaricus]